MPKNKPVLICASCAAVLAALAHLVHPPCPIAAAASPDQVISDLQWGTVVNLAVSSTPSGDEFTATDAAGRHRVLRAMKLAAAGKYRISIDTRYVGTAHMAIEVGGPHQPYGIVKVNLKNGTIEKVDGEVTAGVELVIAQPGRYRWWIDMALNAGEFDYNFSILSAYAQHEFPGSGICRFVLSNPSVRPLDDVRTQ